MSKTITTLAILAMIALAGCYRRDLRRTPKRPTLEPCVRTKLLFCGRATP